MFGSVAEAMERKTARAISIVFVPPAFTKGSSSQAIEAKISLVVVITEGVPVQETPQSSGQLLRHPWTRTAKQICIIGPNCPGIITEVPGWYYRRTSPARARLV